MKAPVKYEIDEKIIYVTGLLRTGKMNNILLARETTGGRSKMAKFQERDCILLEVENKEISKGLSGMLWCYYNESLYDFSGDGKYFIVAPYTMDRDIRKYMPALIQDSGDVFKVCRRLIDKISELSLPIPLIYIILRERKINIDKCRDIYFTYDLDLSKLDVNKNEAHCANECAALLEEILISNNCENYGITKLIKIKNKNGGYGSFAELALDWQEEGLFKKFDSGFLDKVKLYWLKYRKYIVRVVIILSVLSVIAAASMLFSKVVLRRGSFEYIGTERLK